MSSFKIFFSADNIRRFRTDKTPTFDEFVSLMCKQYPAHYHPELRIQYTDTEGDRIDVNSQLEWEEMFVELKGNAIFKIHIVEGKTGQYFKDGPGPQPMHFYDSKTKQEFVPEESEVLKSRIPQCLQELWPTNKILPHNIPSFLVDCVSVSQLRNNEVDLDVDVRKLESVVFRTGCVALEKKDYILGRKCLFALSKLKPSDPLVVYNLACAECLLGNLDEALSLLVKSVDLGFRDVHHIRNDEDLTSLRNLDAFSELCNAIEFNRIPQLQTSTQPTIPQKIPLTPLVPAKTPELNTKQEEKTPEPVTEPEEKTPEALEIPAPVPPPTEEGHELVDSFVSFNLSDSMLMDPNALCEGRKRWAKQLEVLHELGFMSDSVLIPLLEVHKGSVEKAVQELLLM